MLIGVFLLNHQILNAKKEKSFQFWTKILCHLDTSPLKPILSLYSLLEVGIELWLRQQIYCYLYKAYTVSLAPNSTLFLPIYIMPHALEPSYQLLGHGKQFENFYPYTIASDSVYIDI